MWRIYYGSDIIGDPRLGLPMVEKRLDLALNQTGNLEFTLLPQHEFCGKIELLQKAREIRVEQDGEAVFIGRAMSAEQGFDGSVKYTCEGERGYLNDAILPAFEAGQGGVPSTASGLFNWMVTRYNDAMPEGYKFVVGINQGDELSFNVQASGMDGAGVWETMRTVFAEGLGGYIRTRHDGARRYIDLLASGDKAASQRIRFGENLLDFARRTDATSFCTRVRAVGGTPEGAESPITLESLGHRELQAGYELDNGWVMNLEAEKEYGVIEGFFEDSSTSDAETLLRESFRYLANIRVGDTLELTALDLSAIDPDVKPIRIGDYVRATSKPHGFDEWFICTQRSYDLDAPENDKFVLGSEYDTLTGAQSKKLAELNASIQGTAGKIEEVDAAAVEAARAAQDARDAADDAQEAADSAQQAADGKATIYSEQPSEYKANDLWVQAPTDAGGTANILVAVADSSGSYSASDWERASDYTNDAAANAAQAAADALATRVTTAETNIEQNQEQIELRATKTEVAETYATKAEAKQTDSGSGRSVAAESASKLMELTVYGESVQDGTPTPDAPIPIQTVRGINLLDYNAPRKTGATPNTTVRSLDGSGVWVGMTRNNYCNPRNITSLEITDSAITFSSASAGYGVGCEVSVEPGATYYVSGTCTNSYGRIGLGYYDSAGSLLSFTTALTPGVACTVPVGCAYAILVITFNSNNQTGTFSNIQLEKGSTPTPYVPYGAIGLQVHGRNYFDTDTYKNWTAYTVAGSSGYYYTQPIFLKPNTTYTISMSDYSQVPSGYTVLKYYTTDGITSVNDAGTLFYILGADATNKLSAPKTFTTGTSGVIRLGANNASTGGNYASRNVMLEESATATDYEPYYSQITPIPLDGNVLASLPDGTKDTLNIDSAGHVTLTKRTHIWNMRDYVSDSDWGKSGSAINGYYLPKTYTPAQKKDTHGNAVCNMATAQNNVSRYFTIINSCYIDSVFNFNLDSSVIGSTVADFKSWLSSNDLYMLAELATSSTVDLGYIEMPEMSDGSTVEVIASLTPSIDASWWTSAGAQSAEAYSTASAMIRVQAGEIEQRVEKDGVIASINLSAETSGGSTLKINADKITFDGTVIFNASKSQFDSHNDARYDEIGEAAAKASAAQAAASKIATNYITETSSADITIHPRGTTAARAAIDTTGLEIFKDNVSVAKYGDTQRIGEATKSHLEADYHSLQLKDKEANSYFWASDLRDSTGYATMVESFVGDGVTTGFAVALNIETLVSVTVDGTAVSASKSTQLSNAFVLTSAPPFEAEIVATYTTASSEAKAFTLGVRLGSANIGAMSVAEGYNTEASGNFSHVEGFGSRATKSTAHAEGSETLASAPSSHAQNDHTIAASPYQTACGVYNEADIYQKYLWILGGGTSSARRNAVTMSRSGIIEVSTYGKTPNNGALGYSTHGISPIVLYDNDSSSSTSVTLSETAANFEHITICYKVNDGQYGSVEVWHPNGKKVQLLASTYNGTAFTKVCTVKINGTSIAQDGYAGEFVVPGDSASTVNNFMITQVVGYRSVV